MVTISLCMIVKNERDVLWRCLNSVRDIADEIIIVDTGSTDETVAIAHEFTQKVFHFDWIDDFAAARNFAFSKATCQYIMWLDADDVLLEKDRQGLKKLKETLEPDTDVVMMKYDLAFDLNGEPTFSNHRERLLRREAGFKWVGAVHEVIVPGGKIVYVNDVAVSHKKLHPSDPKRNLNIMEKQLAKGAVFDPRQQFYYGRELMDNGQYEKAAKVFEDFVQQEKGWVENLIEAASDLSFCQYKMGNHSQALDALFKSFHYDVPRAEILCDLGQRFMEQGRLNQAAYWYEQALQTKPDFERGGFIRLDTYGYLPSIQLCVLYDRLGQRQKAIEMNERAAAFRPDDPSVAYNRKYFSASQ